MSNVPPPCQGVEAAVRLWGRTYDIPLWNRIEEQYKPMLNAYGGEKLVKLQKTVCDRLSKQQRLKDVHMSLPDLFYVAEWKFLKGKPRYAILDRIRKNREEIIHKHLIAACGKFMEKEENGMDNGAEVALDVTATEHEEGVTLVPEDSKTEQTVFTENPISGKNNVVTVTQIQQNETDAASEYNYEDTQEEKGTTETKETDDIEERIRSAIEELSQIKGVGTAIASAIMSLYQPKYFVCMDDEIIDAVYPGKRGYSVQIYMQVNETCTQIARSLSSKSDDEWTPERVGKVLWTAARLAAENKDMTTMRALIEMRGGTSKEESVKRRGRPRKSTEDTEVVDKADEPKKRGRPRSYTEDIQANDDNNETKKRGRPRKSTEDTEATNDNYESKKEGRPRKSTTEDTEATNNNREPKKRGRPRKSTEAANANNETKKRGRPRKSTEATKSNSMNDEAEEESREERAAKRPRGENLETEQIK